MDSDRLNHLHFIIISLSKLPSLNRQHFLLKYCSVEINCIKAVFFTALSTAFDVFLSVLFQAPGYIFCRHNRNQKEPRKVCLISKYLFFQFMNTTLTLYLKKAGFNSSQIRNNSTLYPSMLKKSSQL